MTFNKFDKVPFYKMIDISYNIFLNRFIYQLCVKQYNAIHLILN